MSAKVNLVGTPFLDFEKVKLERPDESTMSSLTVRIKTVADNNMYATCFAVGFVIALSFIAVTNWAVPVTVTIGIIALYFFIQALNVEREMTQIKDDFSAKFNPFFHKLLRCHPAAINIDFLKECAGKYTGPSVNFYSEYAPGISVNAFIQWTNANVTNQEVKEFVAKELPKHFTRTGLIPCENLQSLICRVKDAAGRMQEEIEGITRNEKDTSITDEVKRKRIAFFQKRIGRRYDELNKEVFSKAAQNPSRGIATSISAIVFLPDIARVMKVCSAFQLHLFSDEQEVVNNGFPEGWEVQLIDRHDFDAERKRKAAGQPPQT